MSKYFLLIVLLLSGMLCLIGCGGDDDDSGSNPDASDPPPADLSPSDPAPEVNDLPGDDQADDPGDDLDVVFTAIVPTGLAQTDKVTIPGQGTILTVRCDAIPGAIRYGFTIRSAAGWDIEWSSTPSTSFQVPPAYVNDRYALDVTGMNESDESTQTSSIMLND